MSTMIVRIAVNYTETSHSNEDDSVRIRGSAQKVTIREAYASIILRLLAIHLFPAFSFLCNNCRPTTSRQLSAFSSGSALKFGLNALCECLIWDYTLE